MCKLIRNSYEKSRQKKRWLKSEIWVKDILGLPIYLAGTLAFMKVTEDNTILIFFGLLTLTMAYTSFFVYLFPDHKLHAQWGKVVVLFIGQLVVSGLSLLYAWRI
jgi:hypothetical protein